MDPDKANLYKLAMPVHNHRFLQTLAGEMSKPVAIILLNWNTPVHTANCIRSLLTYSDTGLFDIIVADNGSTDGSLSTLKLQFPDLIFLDNKENLGFAEGNNRAIHYSIEKSYAYSLIMNNDTEVGEDLVKGLLQHMEHHPEAGAVQPAIYWLHQKNMIWNGDGRYNPVTGNVWSNTKDRPAVYKNADWLTGCCMMVRNQVLQQTGFFNQHFFLYYEDVELSFRIRAAGHELHYVPGLKMYHEAGASAQLPSHEKEGTLSPVMHYYVNRNHIWFLRRFGRVSNYPIMFFYHLPRFLGTMAYFLLKGRRKKAQYLFNGIKDGFFTPERLIWPPLLKDRNP